MFREKDMTDKDDQIQQLKARISELEMAMNELAKSAFVVIRYFARRDKNET